jgi:hypothetical protein
MDKQGEKGLVFWIGFWCGIAISFVVWFVSSFVRIEIPKNDPMRNFTAKEANEILADCEDTPENRKKWAEAGTPMRFEKK